MKQNFNHNQRAIEAARQEINGWRNDNGTFYPQSWEADMGNKVYNDPGRQNVEVSLPNILNVENAAGVVKTVSIGAAFKNFAAANFGNDANITISYTSNNPLVPFTYGEFLGTTIGAPLQVGLIRIQAATQAQATATLSLLRNPGVGKFEGQSLFPLVYPNQFINTITYVENAFKLDGFTSLSYVQSASSELQIYLYANANVNVDRAFSNERVVQEYLKPQTGISQSLTIQGASSKGAMARGDVFRG